MNNTIFKTNGTKVKTSPKGKYYTLEELQTIVGGLIQIIHVGDYDMVIDDEGKLKGKHINIVATAIARKSGAISPYDFIVGDALITNQLD